MTKDSALIIHTTSCWLWEALQPVFIFYLKLAKCFYSTNTFWVGLSLTSSLTSEKIIKIRLYVLRTVKNTLNQESLFLLHDFIFHCHLLYVAHIWSSSNSGPINNLFKLQKAAVRIISGASYNSHTEPLFKKTGNSTVA